MELVSAYDSDGSGDDKKDSKRESKQPSKEIDVIEITDSDSDFPSPDKSNKDPITKLGNDTKHKQTNTTVATTSASVKTIECIDIDDDEDETTCLKEKVTLFNNTTDLNVVSKSDKAKTEKIDYLNLESSDSEHETENIHEKVNNLLNSAAVLSDVSCGPQKSAQDLDKNLQETGLSISLNKPDSESHTFSTTSLKNIDSFSQSENKIIKSDNVINQEKVALPEPIVNKRFKRETETPKSSASATDIVENEDFISLSSFMYRKEERITAAFAKGVTCRLPRQVTRHYISHGNIVSSLQWCIPQYSHLLLSASVDTTIKVWDMCCKQPVRNIKDNLGLRAAKWSLSGEQIIAGGYGKRARVFDVLSGKEIISYDIFHHVSSIESHPYMDDIFLCGTRNAIFGFDLRVNSTLPVRTFLSKCDEVQDIVFLDENEFVCSTSVVSHDSADRTIMVWDFSTGAIMSNQIYLERYTCPSLKVHPYDSCFIAQTSGDYIAAFSTKKPYKIKDKRYMGHKVSGYGVDCDISPDGKYIASGDANGDIYFYNYSNTNVVNKLTGRWNTAINKLKWHPALNSTLASATWDGHIQIWK